MTDAKQAQRFTAEERRLYLGGSEIAAVMGRDPYRTPLQVFNEKTGRVAPFEGNADTERGNILEPIAADFYTKLSGYKLRRRNHAFVHPEYPFIVGHIDREVVGEKRLVEIKCVRCTRFQKLKRKGLNDSWIIQAQVYMGLTGVHKLTWVIFCADEWDAAIFDVEFDQTIYDAAVEAARQFWTNHILTDTPPNPDKAEAAEAIEIEKIGGTLIERDDETFKAAMALKLEAKRLAAEVKELDELANTQLKDAVEGIYGIYQGGGGRFYYSQQNGRKTFDKKMFAQVHPEIDLSRFEKQGLPFEVVKVTALN